MNSSKFPLARKIDRTAGEISTLAYFPRVLSETKVSDISSGDANIARLLPQLSRGCDAVAAWGVGSFAFGLSRSAFRLDKTEARRAARHSFDGVLINA
jgi:hypothetical protein